MTVIAAAVGADLDITTGDFSFINGDIQMLTGLDLVEQRIYLRVIPERGDVLMQPDVGAGVVAAVDQPFTQLRAAQLASDVTAQMVDDPAIQQVDEVDVAMPQPGQAEIGAFATMVGGFKTALSIPIS